MSARKEALRLAVASGGRTVSRRARDVFGFRNQPSGSESCENCLSMLKDGRCQLFRDCNEKLPGTFRLEEKVDRDDYCKAWQQR
jgi:hypothetical protein